MQIDHVWVTSPIPGMRVGSLSPKQVDCQWGGLVLQKKTEAVLPGDGGKEAGRVEMTAAHH